MPAVGKKQVRARFTTRTPTSFTCSKDGDDVTGGHSVDAKTVAPGEHRSGGSRAERRQLKKGDVLIVAQEVPTGDPAATLDLATEVGVKAVAGVWRYSDTRIIETDFFAAGEDGQPGNRKVKTYDYAPRAGGSDFDDSSWETIKAADIAKRRGNGRISFNWYRINITVPETVGGFATNGSTLVFQTALDDYAEVWVDGELVRYLGQRADRSPPVGMLLTV